MATATGNSARSFSHFKKTRYNQLLMAAACAAGLGAARAAESTTVTWSGPTSDQLWSDTNNWTGGLPAGNDVVFGNTGSATTPNTVTNIVDQNLTINSLLYNNAFDITNSASIFHTTQINSGVTLNITGTNGLQVGALLSPAGVTGLNTSVAITGIGGRVNVSNSNGVFLVSNDLTQNTAPSTSSANLDLTGLGTFTANVNLFLVGTSTNGTLAGGGLSSGNLILADTNVITTGTMAIAINVTNSRGSSMTLGRINTINADTILIGQNKGGPGTFSFNGTASGSSLVLRSRSGTGRTAITVGDMSQQTASAALTGSQVLDLRGGIVDAMVSTLNIGIGQNPSGTAAGGIGTVLASVFFDTGVLDATTINISKSGGNDPARSAVQGNFNVSGGLVKAGSIFMASQATSRSTGVFNLSGGTVQVTTGDLAVGTGTAILNVSGGTLDLGAGGRSTFGNIGSATGSISNFSLTAGTIQNVNNIWVKNALAASGGAINGLTGTFNYDDASSNATLAATINGTGNFNKFNGAGALTVTGGIKLSGTTTINSGQIVVDGGTVSSSIVINPGASLSLTANGGIISGQQITVNSGGTLDASAAPGGLTFAGSGRVLTGAGNINGAFTAGSGVAVNPGDIGTINTLTFGNDLNFAGGSTLNVDINSSIFSNDLFNVAGNLNLTGVTAVNVNALGSGLASGSYTLIQYGGALNGGSNNFSLTGGLTHTRSTFKFDTSTPNQVNLLVTGGSPASLIWHGDGAANRWNTQQDATFLNGSTPDQFFALDSVTFDDSGLANNHVNIADTVIPTLITVSSSGNYFFQGTGKISGSGQLLQQGSGTLFVTNTNDFTGGTVISAGTINVGNGSASGTLGTGMVTNNAALVLNRSDAFTFSNALAGSGTITVISGTATLGADNSNFFGSISVTSGLTLKAGATNALGQAQVNVPSGAVLDVAGQSDLGALVTVSGSGINQGGAIINSGASQTNALSSVTLAGDTTFGGTARWDIRGGSGLNTNGNPYNLTINAAPAGLISLANTSVDSALADVNIISGTLSVEGNTFGLGSQTNTISIQPAGVLQLTSLVNPLTKQVTLNGGSIFGSAGTANNIAGNVAITANSTANAGTSATLFITGQISGSNSLSKIGTGTLTLTGDNSNYTGQITVSGGSINVASNTALGSTNAGTVIALSNIVGGGFTLGLVGGVTVNEPLTMFTSASPDFRASIIGATAGPNSTWVGPITLIGNGFDQFQANGPMTMAGNISGTAGTILLRGAGQGVLSGTVNLNGILAHADAGSWTISGSNNLWNTTQVFGGKINLGISNAFPGTAQLLLGQVANANIGTVDMLGFDQIVPSVAVAPGSTGVATNQTVTNSNLNMLSTLTINAGTASTSANRFTGNLALMKSGPSTVTLSTAANTYTGGTFINAGILRAGIANTLPANGTVTLGSATLDLNSFSQSIGLLSGSAGSAITLGNATLTIGGDNTSSIYAGNISDTGGNSTNTGGTLLKAGSGTLQLTRATGLTISNVKVNGGAATVGSLANTATGPLTVAGTLNVADTALLTLSASTAGVGMNGGVVHSAGNLTLNNTGILDLNNNALNVGTAVASATIRQYLTNGYSNGNWNGTAATGGGSITSTWAANDATHRTAVGYAAQPDGTTLVAATLYGDTTLKGSVGLSDYNTLAANFNKPGVWAQGDFDYDGTVTLADYNKLATNFNKSAQPGGGVAAAGAGAAAKAASVTLTGSASPAASVLPDGVVDPGAGNVVLEANPSTGQLYLVGHDSNINSYEVDSAAGKLTFVSQKNHGGYNTLTAQSGSTGLPGSALGQNEDIWATISSAAGTFVAEAYPAGSNPAFDTFGPGLQTFDLNVSGLSAWTAGTPISDLTFKYGNGTGDTLTPAVIDISGASVPEPTCLALAGIAAGGLLSRRRRARA